MKYELGQKFYFDAAHKRHGALESIHGHSYQAEVTFSGTPSCMSGRIVDIEVLKREIDRLRNILHLSFLDDIKDLGPTTLENLCSYIARQLGAVLPNIARVCVSMPASGDSCTLHVD
jgi:6-pyruvoyltetrahydropterin/6-carboxytetrahydropterin synthase